MIAITFMIGTKYYCNLQDQIWLQWWSQLGPNMIATSISNRTIYYCNLFQSGLNMIAISKFVLKSRDYDFWTNLAKTNFRSLQSYLVQFGKIAIIYGPIRYWHCKHIWPLGNEDCIHIRSSFWLSLQSYLVLFVGKIAIIFGPNDNHYCNFMWSSPIDRLLDF